MGSAELERKRTDAMFIIIIFACR